MRLTLHTDYAFRVLMALALVPDQVKSVDDLAREFGVSKNHLMKVAQNLTAGGFISTVRGRNGGLRLAMPARDINLKAVAEHMEPDFNIAGCFGDEPCSFLPRCGLKGVLGQAKHAFLQTLGKHDLESIL
ncbi:MAG: RrF2 family transcriptional regulator [Hoeflea sp.]|uniref:RrF2 family transcriptional regulator n=1 Tax=Hoeflea sp. TaxID=1940281 RepID=UPI003EF99E2F